MNPVDSNYDSMLCEFVPLITPMKLIIVDSVQKPRMGIFV